MNSLISVVIPAYNCSKSIRRTLEAMGRQTYSGPIEVIVVDDGSTDDSAAVIKTFFEVKYIFQKNAGPATARNRGAREAQGEFIFFTDSDCVPQSDWIEKTLQGFSSEKIGVVAGSYGIANPESPLARCVHDEIIFRHQRLMPAYIKVFGSYNFCIRKKVFNEVRGFDEGYPHPSGEDNDLSYRVGKAGYQIYFEKASLVDHYHPTRFIKYMKEQYRHGFWRVKMYVAHPEMAKGDDYTFWKDIVEIPLAAIICAVFFLSFLKWPVIFTFACFLLFVLFVLEFFFSGKFCKALSDVFLMTFILSCRSFSRLFGFSSGFIAFLLKKE